MKAARIMVFFEDALVEDRVLQIDRSIVIGDDPEAEVHFPGWTLSIRRELNGLAVDGQSLTVGHPIVFQWAGVRVQIEGVRTHELARDPLWNTDLRFPFMMLAMFLVLMGFQSFSQAVSLQLERGPLMVAGWVLVAPQEPKQDADVNPNFDLEVLDRMGTFQEVHAP